MANFMSHIIMSEKLYSKLHNKNIINKDVLKMYSLGQDLTIFNINCFRDAHTCNSTNFFIETLKYIKENNLENDSMVMSYLYGHIAHYAFDITIHPIIGNITHDTKNKSFIKAHTYFESEMDKFLLRRNKIIDYSFLNNKNINNKNIKNLINSTYRTSLSYYNVSSYYKGSIFIIKFIKNFVNILYNKDLILNKIARINSYDVNSNFYKFINSDDKTKNKIMNSIFKSSINLSLKYIKEVNNYLYKNASINTLYELFDGTPYDVGVIKNVSYDYDNVPVKYKLLLQIK